MTYKRESLGSLKRLLARYKWSSYLFKGPSMFVMLSKIEQKIRVLVFNLILYQSLSKGA